MATGEVSVKVARGAELLDRMRPDWIKMPVDLIDFRRIGGDPLTLLWASWSQACALLTRALGGEFAPAAYGFCCPVDSLESFDLWTTAWRDELAKRKAGRP